MLEAGLPVRLCVMRLMTQYSISRRTAYDYVHKAEAIMRADDDGPVDCDLSMGNDEILSSLTYAYGQAIVSGDANAACKLIAAIDKVKRWQAPGHLREAF